MVEPVKEIAVLFESRTGCIVKIIKGGSGTLYRSIIVNTRGDLYLPGSESYITIAEREETVVETVIVGYNRASIFVRKGNPLSITPNLQNLINPNYKVVLGTEDSGSIGKETARILRRHSIYDEAMANALYLTSDSKDLTKAIEEKKADLVINWMAAGVRLQNTPSPPVQVLVLSDEQAPPHTLIMGLLTFSNNSELARDFMALASSNEGQEVFRKYGFGN